MVRDSIARPFPATFIVLSITGFSRLADTSEAARAYDIQVGCFADPGNGARLVSRLQDHTLHLKHYGNRYMALLAYNGTNNPNYEYPRKVLRFYQREIRHFLKSSERYGSKAVLKEGSNGSLYGLGSPRMGEI